jgi:PBP4 family serine-type D-alanyl-D-alanine carboxypeptidase
MQKLFLFILINIIFAHCIALAEDSKLGRAIDQLVHEVDPDLNIGIKITNLDSAEVLVEKNINRYFIPASSLKFVSIVSLMDYFGVDYRFTSQILSQNKDYYLEIQDPEFQVVDLDAMIKSIGEHANGNIQGNIYIIDDSFSVPAVMYSKTYSDTLYCNSGPITEVHINKNCSKLDVEPSEIGEKISVKITEDFPYKVKNNAVTIEDNVLDRLYVSIKDDQYIIDGTLSKTTGKIVIGAVANDNFAQLKRYIAQSLSKHKIKLEGDILYGKAKNNAIVVAAFSKSMLEVASTAMKKSDNFTTDYLLAMFATKNNHDKWENAVKHLKDFIKSRFKVDLSRASLYDASGISRMDLITVNQMASFLSAVAKEQSFETIKTIMASPGDDCTLKERFKDKSQIYTKTGSLGNVSTLVGYFYKNGQLHSFVIMANNFYGDNAPYKKLEENIVKLAIEL